MGWQIGLAPRIVPSVEQADSAILCSRLSHILYHVRSRRLAHTQMDPEHQQRAAFPLEMRRDLFFYFLVLEVSLQQAKLKEVHTTDWDKSPRVSGLVIHVQEIKKLLSRWKGLLHCFQTARGRRWGEDKGAGGKKKKKQ